MLSFASAGRPIGGGADINMPFSGEEVGPHKILPSEGNLLSRK